MKTDTGAPERMKEADWYKVDVLTCAAPNLRKEPSNLYNTEGGKAAAGLTRDKLKALLYSRMKRIFRVSMTNGADER